MRVRARLLGAGLLLSSIAAALWLLPAWIARLDVTRSTVANAAGAALGRPLEFEELGASLLPPSLVLGRATLAGGLISAERVELKLEALPLLAGIVAIDSAIAQGARIGLLRTQRGIGLDEPDAGLRSESPEPGAPVAAVRDREAPRLVLRRLVLSGALELEDRTIAPPLRWELRDFQAVARFSAIDAPVVLELKGVLASGGDVRAQGEVGEGGLELRVEVESLDLAAARPYFESGSAVAGLASGSVQVTGRPLEPGLEVRFRLRDARFRLGEIRLRGEIGVDAEIRDALRAPAGRVLLDATQAELEYAGFFTKPPGTPASVRGLIEHADGKSRLSAWKFEMEDLQGRLPGRP